MPSKFIHAIDVLVLYSFQERCGFAEPRVLDWQCFCSILVVLSYCLLMSLCLRGNPLFMFGSPLSTERGFPCCFQDSLLVFAFYHDVSRCKSRSVAPVWSRLSSACEDVHFSCLVIASVLFLPLPLPLLPPTNSVGCWHSRWAHTSLWGSAYFSSLFFFLSFRLDSFNWPLFWSESNLPAHIYYETVLYWSRPCRTIPLKLVLSTPVAITSCSRIDELGNSAL